MSMVQMLADPIDPASYARLYLDARRGPRPRLLHYEGLGDTFTPPVTAEALAVALQATAVTPLVKPIPWLGPHSDSAPMPPRAFAQFSPTRRENGHFVLYREPGAAKLAMRFWREALGSPP
jgi:hypothetical protein